MDPTHYLKGEFAFIVLMAAGLTLLFSVLLLYRYRRATLREMARQAKHNDGDAFAPELQPLKGPDSIPKAPLSFNELSEQSHGTHSHAVIQMIRRKQRKSTVIYVAGGIGYAVVMSMAWLLAAGGLPNLSRVMMLLCLFTWPTVIALLLSNTVGRREAWLLVGAYCMLLLLVISFVIMRNPELGVLSLLQLWLITNLPPSVLFLFLLHRRIRAVGPLVFAFLLCGLTGSLFLFKTFAGSDVLLNFLAGAGNALGLGAVGVLGLLMLVGFVLFAVVGRIVLRILGAAYQRKSFSDRSLALDAMWLIFAVCQGTNLAYSGTLLLLAAPLAYAINAVIVTVGFRRMGNAELNAGKPLELLLLRVFSLGRKSHRFFDQFSRLWRQVGSINMIAGPDLVTSQVEPHEFLAFAGGDIARSFVLDQSDLDRRFTHRDNLPDPDGRYRVNEFFCHDNTWKMTMQRLARDSTGILMDLRSFSSTNKGCLYELKVLLDTIDLRRIVFVIDATTDRRFLEQSFQQLWAVAAESSPNLRVLLPSITLCTSSIHGRAAQRLLIGRLSTESTLF